ncbi:alpha/beta hydrolase family protein [Allorhizocola rhizosphaerae]|uniref:alpha/beta hydrolase family protein n=1 Tax=Allorhizocola rhizosphaerae TaxID=1872709 RepID=UPI0013C2A18A|nr:lipase family protein [Allorhizocola rhizosphaerae]
MRLVRAAAVAVGVLLAVMPAMPVAAKGSAALGAVIHSGPLPQELRLAGAGKAWKVWYVSTSWRGGQTVVTGTLTLPAGRAPAGGWPVVSFGHGFGGVADACAQSRTGPSPWERSLQERFIAAGYAVAVADFEGIGTPAPSPGVAGNAEAYNMTDIVRAARRIAPVARRWVAVGYSLGGHAALFTSALTAAYAPRLDHAGTIALAPVTQWAALIAFGRDPAAPAQPTTFYSAYTLELTSGGAYRAADWFTPAGLAFVRQAGTLCIDELAERAAGLTNADVFTDPAAAADELTRRLAPQEIPIAAYPEPVRVAHGTADTLPAVLSEITAGQLAAAGTEVSYTPVPGADHFTLLPTVAPDVVHWAEALLSDR